MTTEEQLLSNGGGDGSMLFWLSRLPIALKAYPSIEVASIRFDANRNELRLEASMADFQTFEKVRIKLAEQFDVVQGPLDRNENRVSGSFVLRSKP
jgi:general secretion pathway protein L